MCTGRIACTCGKFGGAQNLRIDANLFDSGCGHMNWILLPALLTGMKINSGQKGLEWNQINRNVCMSMLF